MKKAKRFVCLFACGLISNSKIKAEMGNKMNEGMLAPYEKMIKNLK